MIDTIASIYGLNQLIQEPTDILNLSSFCLNLIFTSQPNLVKESGIHSSLQSICHYQIAFAKFNLSIYCPPTYKRTVCNYKRANTEIIRRFIDQFECLKSLSDVNVNEKFYFLTKKLLTIIQYFISHETIILWRGDLPWINKEIKTLMAEKKFTFNLYCSSNKNMSPLEKCKALQNQLNTSIE